MKKTRIATIVCGVILFVCAVRDFWSGYHPTRSIILGIGAAICGSFDFLLE